MVDSKRTERKIPPEKSTNLKRPAKGCITQVTGSISKPTSADSVQRRSLSQRLHRKTAGSIRESHCAPFLPTFLLSPGVRLLTYPTNRINSNKTDNPNSTLPPIAPLPAVLSSVAVRAVARVRLRRWWVRRYQHVVVGIAAGSCWRRLLSSNVDTMQTSPASSRCDPS